MFLHYRQKIEIVFKFKFLIQKTKTNLIWQQDTLVNIRISHKIKKIRINYFTYLLKLNVSYKIQIINRIRMKIFFFWISHNQFLSLFKFFCIYIFLRYFCFKLLYEYGIQGLRSKLCEVIDMLRGGFIWILNFLGDLILDFSIHSNEFIIQVSWCICFDISFSCS